MQSVGGVPGFKLLTPESLGFLNAFTSVDKAKGVNHLLDFCYPGLKHLIVYLSIT